MSEDLLKFEIVDLSDINGDTTDDKGITGCGIAFGWCDGGGCYGFLGLCGKDDKEGSSTK